MGTLDSPEVSPGSNVEVVSVIKREPLPSRLKVSQKDLVHKLALFSQLSFAVFRSAYPSVKHKNPQRVLSRRRKVKGKK